MYTDPWLTPKSSTNSVFTNDANKNLTVFEDNFCPVTNKINLPDTDEYLARLERKLDKLKTGPSVLQELTSHRKYCVERLLLGKIDLPSIGELGFDDSTKELESDKSVGDLLRRHIRPQRPINSAEILHLLRHDQLQESS